MYTLPSFLEQTEFESFDAKSFGNVTLKIGQVIRINYPDTTNPGGAKLLNYDVFISETTQDSTFYSIMYGVLSSNLFGGLADYCDYTFRPNVDSSDTNGEQILLTGAPIKEADYNKILGSMVIVACVDGNSDNNVIIGAVPNYLNTIVNKDTYKLPTANDGHFLNFMFNGINVNINKFGELFIQRQGVTNADGSLAGKDASERNANEDKANSFIKINQDGEIILSTTTKKDAVNLLKEDLEHSVVIDKDGNINIKIDSGQTLEIKSSNSDATLTLGDGAKSVTISEALQQMYLKLLEQLRLLTVSTAFGPSGPPINATAFPDWDSAINSKSMKLPK